MVMGVGEGRLLFHSVKAVPLGEVALLARVQRAPAPLGGARVEGNFLPGLRFFSDSFLRSSCDFKEARA